MTKKDETRQSSKKSKLVEMTGNEILVQTLVDLKVDTLFGYPGGVVIGLYDKLYKTPELKHYLVRHEQGATHAADGYARATGKPGVVLVTSGPGATNTITGIATAYMDAIPMIVFSGQVPSGMIGNDAFQEADIIGITRPITKHSYLVKNTRDLQRIIHKAFYIATTGKPGPVLIDLPKDILVSKADYEPDLKVSIRGYNPTIKGHSQQIAKAARMINRAKRPLIYAGGGVILGNASDALTQIAKKGQIPVTTTLMGIGAFPEDNALSLGMPGMHGTWSANMAMTECDVMVCIGARFDDRVTGRLDKFAPDCQKIHIDIDPTNIAKNVPVDIPIVGDVNVVLPELLEHIEKADTEDWLKRIQTWKIDHPLRYRKAEGEIPPQYVLEKMSGLVGGEAVIATDVGQNQMWAAQFFEYKHPRTILTSGGLGTMGYGFPAAMGAAIGCPDKTVICVTGDGGFQMNFQELATAVEHQVPVKVILLNNGYLGMVRQWQELFFDKHYAATILNTGNPDFIKLAESFGAKARRITRIEEVEDALKESLTINDKPVVMEFIVSREANVFPMVPAGAALNEMLEEAE